MGKLSDYINKDDKYNKNEKLDDLKNAFNSLCRNFESSLREFDIGSLVDKLSETYETMDFDKSSIGTAADSVIKRQDGKLGNSRKDEYDYVKQPPHYLVFTPDEVKKLAAENKGIDADMIARKRGLDTDTYMYMINKYTLREKKPNEPRKRDVRKINRYSEMWLEAHADDPE